MTLKAGEHMSKAKKIQQSSESLKRMLDTLGPYLPKREFEAPPSPRPWERAQDAKGTRTPKETATALLKSRPIF